MDPSNQRSCVHCGLRFSDHCYDQCPPRMTKYTPKPESDLEITVRRFETLMRNFEILTIKMDEIANALDRDRLEHERERLERASHAEPSP